ncbi:amidohydrolase family protein [Candidatus Uabimicrobium amorphum]|uniref:Amidohydrolase-related domain-containing protein n=1 Tax=Uabimicrobium amorphum TaxID=2596890 RepID=A0A5S9F6M7_UABAM|nr:amidohydrolase family protein [Candidatus Uabimicrobium amorphum]BBM88055.1 hypothetical protein UABAM_06471 [Candidatus Uabimicrobium amorphum]
MSIFDIHMYLGKSLFHKDFFLENVQQLQKEYSLTKAAVIPTKPFDYDYEKPNGDLCDLAQNHEDLHHILRVDPWRNEQALRMVKETKSPVLFLHFFEEQIYPTNPLVKQVVEEAKSKNLAVMLACGYLPFSHSAQVQPLVSAFPDVRFIITHGGQINISGMHMAEAFEIFRDHENTFFETSGIYREDYIEDAIDKLGSERVLFGSGSPYYYFPFEVRRIEHLKTSSSIKDKIFSKNAHMFFS